MFNVQCAVKQKNYLHGTVALCHHLPPTATQIIMMAWYWQVTINQPMAGQEASSSKE